MKGFVIALIVIACLVFGAWAIGWLTFTNSDSSSDIEVHKEKVESDTEHAKTAAKKAAKKFAEGTKETFEDLKKGSHKAIDKAEDSAKEGAENVQPDSKDKQADK